MQKKRNTALHALLNFMVFNKNIFVARAAMIN